MNALAQDDTGFVSGLEGALENLGELLPKIGYFLLILVLGAILARIVANILTKVLRRIGFDRLVERGGIKRAMEQSKYDAAGILGKIVYYFIFLLVLAAAFSVFGENPVSDFLTEIIAYLPNLFVAIVVLVIAAAVAAALKEVITGLIGGLSYGPALANAASLFVIALGVFFALDQLQIAPLIVAGLFYALLALIVVPLIIAFGVGGIEPAREMIQDARSRARDKAREIKHEAEANDDDVEVEPVQEEVTPPATRTRRARPTASRARAPRRRPTA